jgi:uncharacterized transporter YbjL
MLTTLFSSCTDWQQFNIQLGITALLFGFGILLFYFGRAGKIRFTMTRSLQHDKRLAVGLAVFLWTMGLVTGLSTVFGWGC